MHYELNLVEETAMYREVASEVAVKDLCESPATVYRMSQRAAMAKAAVCAHRKSSPQSLSLQVGCK